KRRKSYQKLNGHRQDFTQILIQGVLGKGDSLKEKLEVKKPQPKVEVKEEVVEEKVVAKKAPAKKAAAKKAPAKKTVKAAK
ncbi:MAG: hypothetical protein ACJ76F_10635, partial [Bacteroidia bacterium]